MCVVQGQAHCQFFRLQVTAGKDSLDEDASETLAYSGEEIVLTGDSRKDAQ